MEHLTYFSWENRRCALVLFVVLLLLVQPLPVSAAQPDQILQWITIMNDSVLTGGTNPLATSRVVALVASSMFDAVNGIDPQFQPLLVKPAANHDASRRAAAVQAAYVMLVHIYPLQGGPLTTQRNASIAALGSHDGASAIANGVAWGQTVADTIWAIRLTDGVAPPPPPFLGVLGIVGTPAAIGAWRPTPPGFAAGAGPQFASMTPWVLTRPSLFRPPPPPALTDAVYTADYNEVLTMGEKDVSGRTADQSNLALFWAGNTPLFWNRIAVQLSTERSLSFTENAHLFALLNVSMADAAIACWDAKYRYVFWRPVTAIQSGDLDGNPNTPVNATFVPWLDSVASKTPAHPEYPSGHSTVSGAAAFILAAAFGENTAFSVTSETYPGTRPFSNFSAATAEIADARVFGGIHWRNSCVRGNTLGQSVAGYVSTHAMRAGND
jgi:hypothetical protein